MTTPADEVAEASGVFYVISSIAILYDRRISHGIPKSRKKLDVVITAGGIASSLLHALGDRKKRVRLGRPSGVDLHRSTVSGRHAIWTVEDAIALVMTVPEYGWRAAVPLGG